MTSKAERLRSRSSPCGRMPLLRSSPPTVIYMMKVSVACLTCVVWCAVAVRGEDIVDDYQSFADVATSDTEEAEEQSQRQRVARLSGQVDEMLEELRNQNEAIFKHAGHNRILSGKVSELSRDVKLLREQNDDLRQKMQLAEFKAARKIKKVKARLADVTGRLGQAWQEFCDMTLACRSSVLHRAWMTRDVTIVILQPQIFASARRHL